MMSAMLFDAPGAAESVPTTAFALVLVAFPIMAAFCPVLAWGMHALNLPRAARVLIYLPILPVVGAVLIFAVIEFACGGSLTCR